MPKNFPTLETKRLTLRDIRESDTDAYQAFFQDYDLVRFLNANIPWPYPDGAALSWIRDHLIAKQGKGLWAWAICSKENTDTFMGVIEIQINDKVGSRGFWLGRPYWGKGFMSEAADAVLDYAFANLNVDKFLLENAVENTASSKIKAKQGAKLLGIKDSAFVDKAITKSENWELTKDSWLARKKS
ncbi:MAG: GNAT family N-acetyltransferase [Pseudobacteriovorax sp.]|nr:GNAT family N-acetyltransferase [Pseudobacteriovorax sp.]